MTLLNDREIRARCFAERTHRAIEYCVGLNKDVTLSKINNKFYDPYDGRYVSDASLGCVEELTEEDKSKFFPLPTPMISPFEPEQVRVDESGKKIVSYGTSSMGYDVRLANKFKIFTNIYNALIDPLNMPEDGYVDHEGDYVIVPPNSYVLGHTIETFHMPRDVTAICVGKSTYARAGCIVNVTPIEPGFIGSVVLELGNQTNLPLKIHSNMGIAQFMFFYNPRGCETSYADRGGKYQGQTGIQTAIV